MSTSVQVGGRPTGPQVRVLMERFSDRAEGDTVSFLEVSEATGEKIDSNRFRTLLVAWKKALFDEKNIFIESVRGVGVRVVPAAERTASGINKVRRGVRQIRKGNRVVRSVPMDKLSEAQRSGHMRASRVLEEMETDINGRSAQLRAVLSPLKQNPKIGPVAA